MTVIRVSPESVRSYGMAAQQKFEAIRVELESLVNVVVAVQYFGPNAVTFKTRAGQITAEFANAVSHDLGAIADAVRASTSAIAQSLGGTSINIQVNGKTITPPAAQKTDHVEVNTEALDNLKQPVGRHFARISELFQEHLAELQKTDWQGNAKEQAVQQVIGFTKSAQQKATEASTNINKYIDEQVAEAHRSDK